MTKPMRLDRVLAATFSMLLICGALPAFAEETIQFSTDKSSLFLQPQAARQEAYSTYGRGVLPKLDAEAASRIAGLAYRMPAENFDPNPYGDPPWIDLAVFGRPGTQGFLDFVSVNPWTGDVWSRRRCKAVSTPASRQAQAAIRKRFTREESKQYRRLARLKPGCDS